MFIYIYIYIYYADAYMYMYIYIYQYVIVISLNYTYPPAAASRILLACARQASPSLANDGRVLYKPLSQRSLVEFLNIGVLDCHQ